jgi:hypothetical protein
MSTIEIWWDGVGWIAKKVVPFDVSILIEGMKTIQYVRNIGLSLNHSFGIGEQISRVARWDMSPFIRICRHTHLTSSTLARPLFYFQTLMYVLSCSSLSLCTCGMSRFRISCIYCIWNTTSSDEHIRDFTQLSALKSNQANASLELCPPIWWAPISFITSTLLLPALNFLHWHITVA